MVQIRQFSRMLKYAGLGGAGLVTGGVMMSDSGVSSSLSLPSTLTLLAKSKPPVNTLTPETKSVTWDSNWDKRCELSVIRLRRNVSISKGTIEFSQAFEGECNRRGEGSLPGEADSRHQQGQQDHSVGQTWSIQSSGDYQCS